MKFILAVIASITILCFAAGVKTIKDHQDFDRAIEGMSRGVAKGMGITASATDEAVNSIVGLAQQTGKSVTDAGKEIAAALKFRH
jgi:hypothetical protein